MQRKLNDEFIREYCEEFSEKITGDFFADKEHISGKEILNVTPSKQVNFFVLKILFRKWQEEMKRLESPFFNYKNPEVRKAMVQFMNTLSQHIEVGKEHFHAMIEEAVADALLLAVDPGSYISLEFEEMDVTHVTEKMTRPILKYLKLHKAEIEEFFRENNGADLDDFIENAEEYFEDVNVDATVRQQADFLSQVLPLSIEDIYFKEEDAIQDIEEDELPNVEEILDEDDDEDVSFDHDEPEEEGSYDEESFSADDEDEFAIDESEEADDFDETESDDDLEAEADSEEEAIGDEPDSQTETPVETEVEHASGANDDEGVIQEVDVDEKSAEDQTEREDDQDVDSQGAEDTGEGSVEQQDDDNPGRESLNEHFTPVQKTVNEKFSAKENPTLADKLEQKRVGNIMEAISVNHRYMFTKELFDGDREAFADAIEQIQQCESFDDSVELLVQNYANKRSWDMNSDEVKELLKVIFRKFR